MKSILKIFLLNLLFATGLYSQAEEYGIASYYSDLFHGKPTASSELYDKDKLTAAHKTLPFGTVVKVTRLDNKKSVEVKINDRGPFISGRVVEVSRAAAGRLGLDKDGSARVSVEVVNSNKPAETVASAKPADTPKEYSTDPAPVKKESPAAKKESAPAKSSGTAAAKPKETAPAKSSTATAAKQGEKAAAAKPKEAGAAVEKVAAKGGNAKKAAAKKPEPAKAVLVTEKDYKQFDLYQVQLRRPERKGYGVQVAVLSSQDALFKKVAELQSDWFDNILVSVEQGSKKETQYKVILGPFADEKTAQSYKSSLKSKKKINGFVVDLSDTRKDVKD